VSKSLQKRAKTNSKIKQKEAPRERWLWLEH
jgi:hypothetical protein